MEVRATLKTLSNVGEVLYAQPGSPFAIIVANSPGGPIDEKVICYGVVNTATGIIEAYLQSYAKSLYLVREFSLDAKEGYDRAGNRPSLPPGLAAMLAGQAPDDTDFGGSSGGSGKAN